MAACRFLLPTLALAGVAACHRPAPAAAPAPVAAPASVPAPAPQPTRAVADPAQAPTLYRRLGGLDAIRAVVGDFVDRVAADARINGFFRGVDLDDLKGKLTDQICQATGGPCRYTGRPMRAVHAQLGIGNADFDALVGDLVASLDKFKVGEGEKSDLLAALGRLRPEIVTKQ